VRRWTNLNEGHLDEFDDSVGAVVQIDEKRDLLTRVDHRVLQLDLHHTDQS
jgi:hypothetical protein